MRTAVLLTHLERELTALPGVSHVAGGIVPCNDELVAGVADATQERRQRLTVRRSVHTFELDAPSLLRR